MFPSIYRARSEGKLLGDVVRALMAPLEEADLHLQRIQRAHRLLVAEQPDDVIRLAAALDLTRFSFEDLLADGPAREQRMASMRDRVQRIARLHLRGLGTPEAILEAAAIFLDAALVADGPGDPVIRHVDPEGYVHRATVEAVRDGTPRRAQMFLFENPLLRRKVEPQARWPFDSWATENEGVERAAATIAITGVEERTVRPSVIAGDASEGVYFDGIVPDRATLLVSAGGGATLDGRPVDDWLVYYRGGAFDVADLDRAAAAVPERGVATAPFDGDLERQVSSAYRKRATAPAIPAARAQWTFTVAEGVYDGSDADYAVYCTEHLPVASYDADPGFDASVYACPPNAVVGMAWDERIACAYKLVLPPQPVLDALAPPGVNYLGRAAAVQPGFKPAGIRAYVDAARDAWVLGQGVIRGPDAPDDSRALDTTRLRGSLAEGHVTLDAATSREPQGGQRQ
jgi:hypothetical protein